MRLRNLIERKRLLSFILAQKYTRFHASQWPHSASMRLAGLPFARRFKHAGRQCGFEVFARAFISIKGLLIIIFHKANAKQRAKRVIDAVGVKWIAAKALRV